jgi:hypothetical protein
MSIHRRSKAVSRFECRKSDDSGLARGEMVLERQTTPKRSHRTYKYLYIPRYGLQSKGIGRNGGMSLPPESVYGGRSQGTLEQVTAGAFLAFTVTMMVMVMNNFVLGIIGDAYGAVKEENQNYPSLFTQLWDLNVLEVRPPRALNSDLFGASRRGRDSGGMS